MRWSPSLLPVAVVLPFFYFITSTTAYPVLGTRSPPRIASVYNIFTQAQIEQIGQIGPSLKGIDIFEWLPGRNIASKDYNLVAALTKTDGGNSPPPSIEEQEVRSICLDQLLDLDFLAWVLERGNYGQVQDKVFDKIKEVLHHHRNLAFIPKDVQTLKKIVTASGGTKWGGALPYLRVHNLFYQTAGKTIKTAQELNKALGLKDDEGVSIAWREFLQLTLDRSHLALAHLSTKPTKPSRGHNSKPKASQT